MMKDLLDWFKNRFQHPLILMLWSFFFVMLLVGMAPDLLRAVVTHTTDCAAAEVQVDSQVAYLLSGFIFLTVMVLMYRPPKGWVRKPQITAKSGGSDSAGQAGAEAAKKQQPTLTYRRATLSKTQKQLLAYIEEERRMVFDALKRESGIKNDAELYYRLEQLRLLGFVDSERIGHANTGEVTVIYRLSDAYLGEHGDFEVDSTVSFKGR